MLYGMTGMPTPAGDVPELPLGWDRGSEPRSGILCRSTTTSECTGLGTGVPQGLGGARRHPTRHGDGLQPTPGGRRPSVASTAQRNGWLPPRLRGYRRRAPGRFDERDRLPADRRVWVGWSGWHQCASCVGGRGAEGIRGAARRA